MGFPCRLLPLVGGLRMLLVGVAFLRGTTMPNAEPEPGVKPFCQFTCVTLNKEIFPSSLGPHLPLSEKWAVSQTNTRKGQCF